jgi:hypothetical protein
MLSVGSEFGCWCVLGWGAMLERRLRPSKRTVDVAEAVGSACISLRFVEIFNAVRSACNAFGWRAVTCLCGSDDFFM